MIVSYALGLLFLRIIGYRDITFHNCYYIVITIMFIEKHSFFYKTVVI